MSTTKDTKDKLQKSTKTRKDKTVFVSEEDYLKREAVAKTKSEYHAGKVMAMAGAQEIHNRIVGNLIRILGNCAVEADCQVYPSDFLLYLPECEKYVYPDITVVCEELVLSKQSRKGLDVMTNPKILVEVLCISTEEYDLNDKMDCYLKLESLEELVIVNSDMKSVKVYSKITKSEWNLKVYEENENQENQQEIAIKIGDCKIAMKDIYRSIGFKKEEK